MAYDIYKDEQAVIDKVTSTLDRGLESAEEWNETQGELLAEYEKLLKRARQLVRMSDRTEERLSRLSTSLEEKNQILEQQSVELKRAREEVEEIVRERTGELMRTQTLVERLLDIGIALSAERNSERLMERILIEAKDLTNADGGTLYILTREDTLKFEIIRSDSLNFALGGTSEEPITFAPLPMYLPGTRQPNHVNVATHVAHTGQSVNIPDAYHAQAFDFTGTKAFDKNTGYRSKSFLTVPMKNRAGAVIGVLQLINARAPGSDEVITFPREIETYVEALASQAAVALENQNLLEAQKALLDSFIRLIAGAIDEKSPYTGGHCERVPELAFMLTEAVCAAESGPFAHFDLTEEEWYEFKIAGWLHDCGKVTTPEYVVDKATKLETIYNRIHEIRMRFEVMRREAEIDYLKGLLAGDKDAAALAAERDRRFAQIEDDFAFIAECNIGGEFLDDDKIARINEIAKGTWTRHLDDRLGLAHNELARKERTERPVLPVEETVLADKIDHLIYRDGVDAPFGDNPYGFAMEVPEHEYNYGEIHNLCIKRGTLASEERYKINHHIIQTIIMLKQLPFPKQLERVPEYAGGHHEKMDGKGYPRGLTKGEMSIPARVMAIADIFEALTASDRPYKKAKTLSESIKIMGFMVKDQHIDPELYRLFLESGTYLRYAERFLQQAQIDEVDVAAHLASLN